MADKPQSFAEWIDQQKKAGPPAAAAPAKKFTGTGLKFNEGKGSSAKLDPLSWLVDMVSRPLYGVTETADTFLEQLSKPVQDERAKKMASGDLGGALGDAVGYLGKQVTAPIRGVFSTDRTDKRTTSELIEKATDTAGAYDPKYTDTTDNVNPWVKGIAGFAGDVALDPLTYVPGAAIVGIGKKLGALGKTVKGATAAKGTKAVEDAARADIFDSAEEAKLAATLDRGDALKPVPKDTAVPVPAEAPVVPRGAEVPTPASAPTSLVEELTKTAPDAAKVVDTPVSKPLDLPDLPSVQLLANPKTASAAKAAEKLLSPVTKIVKEAKPEVDWSKAPSLNEWMSKKVGTPEIVAIVGRTDLDAAGVTAFLKDAKVSAADKTMVRDQLKVGYADFRDSLKDSLPLLPAPKISTQSSGILGRFQELITNEANVAKLEKHFGSGIVGQLRRKKTEASFIRTMTEISDVLSRKINLDALTDGKQLTQGGSKILRYLGIDPVDTNVRIAQAESMVKATEDAKRIVDTLPPGAKPSAEAQAIIDKLGPATPSARKGALDAEQAATATTLAKALKIDIFDTPHTMPHRTKAGVPRSSKVAGEGFAAQNRILETRTQWNVSKALSEKFEAEVKELGLSGEKRALWMKDAYMRAAEDADGMLQREGFQQYMGTKGDLFPLSDAQLRIILDGPSGQDAGVMLKYLYNVQTLVPTTNLYDAVVAVLKGASPEDIAAQLVKTETPYMQGSRITNALAGDGPRRYGHIGKLNPSEKLAVSESKLRKLPGVKYVRNKHGNKVVGWWRTYDPEHMVQELTGILLKNKAALESVVSRNAESLNLRISTETGELTELGMTKMNEFIENPTRRAAAMRAIDETPKMLRKAADDAGTTQDALVNAKTATDLAVGPEVQASVEGLVKVEKAQKLTGDPKAGKEAAQARANDTIDNVEADFADDLAKAQANAARTVEEEQLLMTHGKDELVDITEASYRASEGLRDGIWNPFLQRFHGQYGQQQTRPFAHSANVASNNRRATVAKELNKIQRTNPGTVAGTETTVLKKAWDDLREGIRGQDPQVLKAQDELDKFFSTMFDTSASDSILGNVFFRNATSVERVSAEMAAAGLPFEFRMADAAAAAKIKGTDILTEAIEQWRTWDVENPVEFLAKMYAAAERVSTHAITGQSFTRWATEEGLTSSVPKKGYAKATASGKSLYVEMLDSSLYYDRALLNEFGIMDKVAQASHQIDGEMGKFIHKVFDPIQSTWKYAITLPRPGHHIRNLVGDTSMTFMAEGMQHSVRASKDAWRVLAAKKGYTGLDLNRAMESLGDHVIPNGSKVLSKGKYGDFTIDEIFEAAYSSGLLNSYRAIEDFAEGTGGLQKFMNKISFRGGKVEEGLGDISQARDHLSRMHHFLQYIYKQQDNATMKSREEMLRAAAHQVKKHHPDGSMLTPFEAKYMRRIIPFYSWLRGALPAIVESAALHPARANSFNKASYNLAVGMGVDPYSLSDPFPEDQLFPSFLNEQMLGPVIGNAQDGYTGINPGVASIDVANMLGPDPIRGIAGATSPLFRIPAELLSGGQWGTGTKIKDTSDYLDSSIPGVNYVANVTGQSVTGSLASILQGRGLDQQYQVKAGNKTFEDQMLSVVNWLTGAGVQNMSKPNYINYAEIEKRNASGKDSGGNF